MLAAVGVESSEGGRVRRVPEEMGVRGALQNGYSMRNPVRGVPAELGQDLDVDDEPPPSRINNEAGTRRARDDAEGGLGLELDDDAAGEVEAKRKKTDDEDFDEDEADAMEEQEKDGEEVLKMLVEMKIEDRGEEAEEQ